MSIILNIHWRSV